MPEQNDANGFRVVIFRVAEGYYALDISLVSEIVRMQKITKIPDTKEYIKGVINLRGQIIPVVSLRKRFRTEEEGSDKKTRIVIVAQDDFEVGIIIDEVYKVVSVMGESLEPATEEMIGKGERFFNSVLKSAEGIIGILNLEVVLENRNAV